jgi:hypothetical protein
MERRLNGNRTEDLCPERYVQWFRMTAELLTDTIIPLFIAQNPAAEAWALFALNCRKNVRT